MTIKALTIERSHFHNPLNLIKNSEVIMSSQNIQQQIKNSHSLLPASRDPPPTPYAIALSPSRQLSISTLVRSFF
ncbi:MAG TPA: hypothetical protein VK211_26355 [Kamptonema sp.]|nr:hypothetical protein [Kamptonema sp.]